MIKKALIVAGLLGMGLTAGFAAFVFNSEDERLLASHHDDSCPWAYSSGTLNLEYRWANDIGNDSPWRAAFRSAVRSWNNQNTNVEWSGPNSYAATTFNSMNLETNYWGIAQSGCTAGSDPVRVYNDIWGNSYYADTALKRRIVATHEVGHGIGLTHHGTTTNDIMYPYCCNATSISDDDEAAVNDLY